MAEDTGRGTSRRAFLRGSVAAGGAVLGAGMAQAADPDP
ncbi:MAG TPA: hypothetical protein DEB47_01060, partial [Citreicella sp.]|nr:hypothetical protein [Citreicella sp.]